MVGERLKEIRKVLELSQIEFAEKLNTQQRNISHYEKNQLDIPDKLKIKLSEMGINLNWLLTGEDSMFKSKEHIPVSIETAEIRQRDQQNKELKKQLEICHAKIEELKKSISLLEKENTSLVKENRDRLKELLNMERKIIKQLE